MEEILNTLIDRYSEEMIENVQELVRIPSVIDMNSAAEEAPFGQAIRSALEEVMELSRTLGFETKNCDGYAASVQFGEGDKEIGILSHIDVVPPGNGWSRSPFEPVIENGRIYGRGAIDDKGPMVAALYAMKAVKESGLTIKNRVNHIIGCDEETGHRCIKYYLSKEKCPDMGFSPDGSFPVIHAEKGILRFRILKEWKEDKKARLQIFRVSGGTVVNAVPNCASVWIKGSQEALDMVMERFNIYNENGSGVYTRENDVLMLTFLGTSAHAMQPWLGINAILPMIDFLRKITILPAESIRYFQSVYELFGDGWEGRSLGIACEDQLSGKLSINLGILNIENGRCEMKADVRCPVHVDLETVWKTIELTCKRYGFDAQYWQKRPPLYIPKEAELIQTLLSVYNEMTGQEVEPIVIGGGTYCRDVENFASFGPVFPGEQELAHEADEYIETERLIETAKIYAQALYQLANK